jgi:hypothetical protein
VDHRPPLEPLPEAPLAPRRRGRGLLWVGLSFLALLAIGFVARAIAVSRATDVLRKHAARARAEFEALRDPARAPPGLPALLPGAPGVGDAADVIDRYVAAVAALPSAERQTVVHPLWHGPKAIDAVLAKHAAVTDALLPVLSVAGASHRGPSPIDDASSAITARNEAFTWSEVAARRALAHGDASRARRLALAQMAFGHEVARGGALIDQMIGSGCQGGALRIVVASLAPSPPVAAAEARELRLALEILDVRRFPADRAVEGDRATFREAVAREGVGATGLLTSPTAWRWLWSERILFADAAENADAMLDAIARAAARVDADPRATASAFPAHESTPNPLIAMLTVPWPHWVRARTNTRALNAVVRARLAIAEWTAAQGAPPAALSDLVPAILPAVPADPWTNAPLRYEAGKVWSEGRTAAGHDDLTSEPSPDDEIEYGEDEEPEPAAQGASEGEPEPAPAPESPGR